jgi:pimeloyl-ACP methyl ester carboxylesterase
MWGNRRLPEGAMMKFWKYTFATVALAFFFLGTAEASSTYLRVGKGTEVYVHFDAPGPGQPTLVLLNGLTYSLENWDSFAHALKKLNPKLGILRFDMIGMGRTLLKGSLPVMSTISYKDQVELTRDLMGTLGIRKAYIAGLSYGGAVAVAFATKHPELVEQVILMAPFTEPLKTMDQWIRIQVAQTRFTFPLNPATDDELYDYFLRNFIYATYPGLEPSVLENPYKLEAIFRMIQGIRHYNTLRDAGNLPLASTHLVVANQDQYIELEVMERFWDAVPSSARASRINITRSEHKIPENIPAFSAAWIHEIIRGRPELRQGAVFEGNTSDFSARSGSTNIRLQK